MTTGQKSIRAKLINVARVIVSTAILALGLKWWWHEPLPAHYQEFSPVGILYMIGIGSCMYWADRLIGSISQMYVTKSEFETLKGFEGFGIGGVWGWLAVAIPMGIIYGLVKLVKWLLSVV